MKILILDFYRDSVLHSFYRNNSAAQNVDFETLRLQLANQHFSPSYSVYLKRLGFESEEIITNDTFLQLQWAKENGLTIQPWPRFMTKCFNRFFQMDWRYGILKKQIEKIRPDILFVHERN